MLTFLVLLLIALLATKGYVNYRFDQIEIKLNKEELLKNLELNHVPRKLFERQIEFLVHITKGQKEFPPKRIKQTDYRVEFALWKQNVQEVTRVRQRINLI